MKNLSEAGRSWENRRLSDHYDDWDISNARDLAIEARAVALLTKERHDPFGPEMRQLYADQTLPEHILSAMAPALSAGDYAAAGEIVAEMLRDFARREALDDARIQIDAEHNEPTGAQLDA